MINKTDRFVWIENTLKSQLRKNKWAAAQQNDMRPAKTQINLDIAQSDQSSPCTQ